MPEKKKSDEQQNDREREIGVGVDIIEVKRVEALIKKNIRFLTRVFTETEISYCSSKANPYQHYAARFAAKEAFFKALGKKVNWTDVGIKNLPSGKPILDLKENLDLPFRKAEVSISHVKEHAIAAVILSGWTKSFSKSHDQTDKKTQDDGHGDI